MAYTAYVSTLPDPATQAGTAFGQRTRDNIRAMRDVIAATGMLQGFDYRYTTGTAENPTTMYYVRNASDESIKIVVTWTSGNVTKMAFYYASNETGLPAGAANGTYDPMADAGGFYVCTLTYDGSGNCTQTSWSATP
jgi:acylphosphatase